MDFMAFAAAKKINFYFKRSFINRQLNQLVVTVVTLVTKYEAFAQSSKHATKNALKTSLNKAKKLSENGFLARDYLQIKTFVNVFEFKLQQIKHRDQFKI